MKEIPQWLKDDYLKLKCEWSKAGSPGSFAEWLYSRIEHWDHTQELKLADY